MLPVVVLGSLHDNAWWVRCASCDPLNVRMISFVLTALSVPPHLRTQICLDRYTHFLRHPLFQFLVVFEHLQHILGVRFAPSFGFFHSVTGQHHTQYPGYTAFSLSHFSNLQEAYITAYGGRIGRCMTRTLRLRLHIWLG